MTVNYQEVLTKVSEILKTEGPKTVKELSILTGLSRRQLNNFLRYKIVYLPIARESITRDGNRKILYSYKEKEDTYKSRLKLYNSFVLKT